MEKKLFLVVYETNSMWAFVCILGDWCFFRSNRFSVDFHYTYYLAISFRCPVGCYTDMHQIIIAQWHSEFTLNIYTCLIAQKNQSKSFIWFLLYGSDNKWLVDIVLGILWLLIPKNIKGRVSIHALTSSILLVPSTNMQVKSFFSLSSCPYRCVAFSRLVYVFIISLEVSSEKNPLS